MKEKKRVKQDRRRENSWRFQWLGFLECKNQKTEMHFTVSQIALALFSSGNELLFLFPPLCSRYWNW
jgi:hypothetical protein